MKKIFLLFASVMSALWSEAAIFTVDNTPVSAAQYSSISNAVTAASSGDTILVYGSGSSYGAVTVNKKLIFVGNAGVDPEVSNESPPEVSYFYFNSANASGTVITGFNIGYIDVAAGVSNVGIYNNYMRSNTNAMYFRSAGINNWVIEGNAMEVLPGGRVFYDATGGVANILFKNNYVEMNSYYSELFYNLNSAYTFRNNVFIIRNNNGYYPFYSCNTVLFENNIFWMVTNNPSYPLLLDITSQQCANCVFNNNIIYNSGGATMTNISAIGNGVTGNNNIMNQNPQFVNFLESGGYTITEDYQLAAGSPGKNAGTDGTDIGLYGAYYKWENRKYPKSFPHQEIFNVINTTVPQGQPININLKAKKAPN
ncbi:MAG: hypothetical protein KatS3mg031_0269 [Chitinophagales bacterium]|nr:MAG: hypothetical protein KatS3mg031_0269 [Chitinophagales bacterium]